jgi:hypothetical protein
MRNRFLTSLATCGAAILWAYGCGSDDPTPVTTTGGQGGATSSTVGVTSSSSSSTTGTGAGPVDESSSCADAVPLEEKQNTFEAPFYDYTAMFGEAGDADFFSFQAQAGDWIRVSTATDVDNPPIDTVVTLLSEDGSTQYARNDDIIGSTSPNSEIVFHVLESGSYCIQVEEAAGRADPTFPYRAVMVPMDFDVYPFYNVDTEPNETTAEPQTDVSFDVGNTLQISTNFAGLWDSATDVDVYEWTAPTGALDVNVIFTPDGTNGFGSTQDPGIINIYEPDGTTLLAQLDVQKGSDRLSSVPVVAGQTYFLEVNYPAAATPGANDFYYLKFFTSDSLNPQELDDSLNDTFAGAEIAMAEIDGNYRRHYIGGLLPVPDEDWWSFTANQGDEIILACSAWRSGAGLRDATFSVYKDPAGPALQTETEGEDEDIYWSNAGGASMPLVPATSAGTYYLRISATQQAPNITSDFYLCGIHVRTP